MGLGEREKQRVARLCTCVCVGGGEEVRVWMPGGGGGGGGGGEERYIMLF